MALWSTSGNKHPLVLLTVVPAVVPAVLQPGVAVVGAEGSDQRRG